MKTLTKTSSATKALRGGRKKMAKELVKKSQTMAKGGWF